MFKIKNIVIKSKNSIKQDGIKGFLAKSYRYIKQKFKREKSKYSHSFKDILFISGCDLPHPQRYRVDHQIEQLKSQGISCDKVFYADLTLEYLNYYRGFVFYRCPILPVIEEFINLAKENNKTIFYDIDDLVFDTKFTNTIPYVQSLKGADKELYDDGVIRMGKTLDLCEYAIASTSRLAKEMGKHVKESFVNRNVASDQMIALSQEALKNYKKKNSNKIIIGYLSGTITHNADFELIKPALIKILNKYENVYLKVVGLLDIPNDMLELKDRIITCPFVDWKELPNLIKSTDINLAPLEDTVFNECKSENKWTEAALVKVPIIASNIGAFKESIENYQTGILCSNIDEWEKALSDLIEDQELRYKIGQNAYTKVMKDYTTISSGRNIADFIKSKLRKNVCFVVPSTNISGGIMVVIKHGLILKENGFDVTLINVNEDTKDTKKVYQDKNYLNVVSNILTDMQQSVETMVATMWLTAPIIQKYPKVKKRKYLVQNMETGFYEYGRVERIEANATYSNMSGIEYITISKWCQKWLKDDFGISSKYAPDGINSNKFNFKKRNFNDKINILVEGNSEDYYKNVDESFKIIDVLDKSKYKISYLSYQGKPKKNYYVDEFFHQIPHDEISKIYENADILIKSSILESFSYPPLEMMATGGLCVVVPNGGNVEYLKDNYNCLFYNQGNIKEAVSKIEQLINNEDLRNKLIQNGLKTVKERDWNNITSQILDLYN